VGFHEVTGYRTASHFEFRLNAKDHLSGVLRAYYFDKGFYFGDPAISDGDVIKVLYASWTSDILALSEVSGHHPGWMYRESETSLGPWLLGAIGALLFIGGIIGWMSDIAAKPNAAGA
jgi:hypothetical protein